ncbi:DUF6445 family protein [Niveibacterium sp. SC-1]|uniref:DUF6445 family protein n=1 Tax=Niveibacterium sp. SC-1 TaxID=3135646 RepID=UPI00311ED8DE
MARAAANPLAGLAPAIRKVVDQALQLQQGGQATRAVELYQGLLKKNPRLAIVHKFLGLALLEAGMRQAGLTELSAAASALPWDGDTQFQFGAALLLVGEVQRGLGTLEKTVRLTELDASLRGRAGAELYRNGRFIAATEAFERLAREQPQRPEVWSDLCLARFGAGDVAGALAASREAVALRPTLAPDLRVGQADPDPAFARPAGSLPPESLLTVDLREHKGALDRFIGERDLHIVDDVLADPHAYREAALKRHFSKEAYSGQNFPGVQTVGEEVTPIMQVIATAIGKPIKWISPDNGAFRVSFGESTARTDIHVDSEDDRHPDDYAAVLYLTPPEHVRGGTLFWRHKATGFDRRPSPEALAAQGFADFAAFQRKHLPRDSVLPFNRLAARRNEWEATVQLPMRFNRLVIYQGNWYHSIGEVFGDSLENGRLVQLFRFRPL